MTGADIDGNEMELEFSEEDVAYYIEDEDGNEIGVALHDGDGNEVEYYYAGDDAEYVEVEEADDFGEEGAFELEFSEGDVAYYIEDEDGNEIGIALFDSDGNEVEYYYASDDLGDSADEEAFELEFSEDDVAYYIEDEDGVEIGVALLEPDGTETEYYYEGVNPDAYEDAPDSASSAGASPAAGKDAQQFVRRAGKEVGKLATKAGAGAAQAATAAKNTVNRIKNGKAAKPEEDEDLGFGLTSGQVKKAAGDFTSLAKEGAQAAAELRGVYDDIFGELDFLKPSAQSRIVRRR